MSENKHQMKLRHKAELKALLSQSTKGIGEKKKLKDQEKALLEKHEQELKQLEQKLKNEAEGEGQAEGENKNEQTNTEEITSKTEQLTMDEKTPSLYAQTEVSRAQKKRDKKQQQQQQRMEQLKAETANMTDLKGMENMQLGRRLQPLALCVKQIQSDGHCLYRAIHDQLTVNEIPLPSTVSTSTPGYMALRQLCMNTLMKNKDDFLPFLMSDDGDMMDDAAYADYCNRILDTTHVVWGGHTEIVALAKALGVRIHIYMADGEPQIVGEGPDVHISWHRHYYGLGDHYNSVVPVQADEDGQ